MVAIIEFERGVACASILRIVIGKLRYWWEPCPVVLSSIHKGTKVSFHYAVQSFYLSVRLRLEYGGDLSLYGKEVTEQGPEFGRENRSAVTDDRV